MTTKHFARNRKRLIEDVLKKIVALYEVNKGLKWGLPEGTYDQRKKRYDAEWRKEWDKFWASAFYANRIILKTENKRYQPASWRSSILKPNEWEFAYNVNNPENETYSGLKFDMIEEGLAGKHKIDIKADSPTMADFHMLQILDVFSTLFEDVTLISCEELRAEVTEKWKKKEPPWRLGEIDRVMAECKRRGLNPAENDNLSKIRLELHLNYFFPRIGSMYIRHSPVHNSGLGAECFAPGERILCEISEYSLAEFNAIFEALIHSIKNDHNLWLKISGYRTDKWDTPEPINPEIAIQGARSVYKIVEEFFLTPKNPATDHPFTSPFEHKLYSFLRREYTIYNVFNGTWDDFAGFTISLLVTHFHYSKNFERFCVCNQCGKLFFPDKFSEAKNKYCSDRCRKASHREEDEVSCYNRQYAWFKNNHKKTSRFILDSKSELPETFKSISRKEVCIDGKCPHAPSLAGGKCTMFSAANPQVLPALEEIKSRKKRNY